MLGIGFFEIVIVALVALVAVGPKQLPMVMKKLAGFYKQFVGLRNELRFQLFSADTDDLAENKMPKTKISPKDKVFSKVNDDG